MSWHLKLHLRVLPKFSNIKLNVDRLSVIIMSVMAPESQFSVLPKLSHSALNAIRLSAIIPSVVAPKSPI